jgi:tetratricopeptide (TPR) repeat protein
VKTKETLRVTVRTRRTQTSLDRAFELKGLDGAHAYRLTLASVDEGARLRGTDPGTVRTVACARKTIDDVALSGRALDVFDSEQQFLVWEGIPVEVRGATALWCGFIDDEDASDNRGAMELRIMPLGPARGMVGVPRGGNRVRDQMVARDLYEYGASLLRQGHLRQAEKAFRQCIAVDPSFARCYMTMGVVATRLGRTDEGASYYRDYVRLAPDDDKAASVRKLLADYDRQRQ